MSEEFNRKNAYEVLKLKLEKSEDSTYFSKHDLALALNIVEEQEALLKKNWKKLGNLRYAYSGYTKAFEKIRAQLKLAQTQKQLDDKIIINLKYKLVEIYKFVSSTIYPNSVQRAEKDLETKKWVSKSVDENL